ncbi:MAG: hypothetical protein KGO94_02120 [Alphaproteobacteria bacterium]|nr:hypothetical protein [Alphaproteobacteria bacterium]
MADRFWYWQGISGRKYIHSVYDVECCPPLPGAVYVGVKRAGHLRVAVAVGRFLPFWDKALPESDADRLRRLGVDEVHVHLLARSADGAEAVLQDLAKAMDDVPAAHGFSEGPVQRPEAGAYENWGHAA